MEIKQPGRGKSWNLITVLAIQVGTDQLVSNIPYSAVMETQFPFLRAVLAEKYTVQ
jgi:hypothetical protein